MARPYGYRLDPTRVNSRHRIGGNSSDMAFTCGASQCCRSAYADIFRVFTVPGMYRPPVYAYMRIVACIAYRVQLCGAIFLALAASRICAAQNCRSLLTGFVIAPFDRLWHTAACPHVQAMTVGTPKWLAATPAELSAFVQQRIGAFG
jgi:hypothetical protein